MVFVYKYFIYLNILIYVCCMYNSSLLYVLHMRLYCNLFKWFSLLIYQFCVLYGCVCLCMCVFINAVFKDVSYLNICIFIEFGYASSYNIFA